MIKNKLCPICNYEDYYDDCSLEDSIGIVEEYSYCPNCGYRYMMSYSDGCSHSFPHSNIHILLKEVRLRQS